MVRVGIVGGTGYTGGELIRLVAGHPDMELVCVTSRQDAGRTLAGVWPQLAMQETLEFVAPEPAVLAGCDVVFFATPHGTAQSMAREVLAAGARVVDLSADFRLVSIPEWERWYGITHGAPELVADAVYGLPEVNREAIREARLVACPGCYPTAVVLGFLPLLEAGLIDPATLIADAKSGVSGAGRKSDVPLLFGEIAENFRPYAIAGHRHEPEIRQLLNASAHEPVTLTFVPHLLPMFRGIEATLYATLSVPAGDLTGLFRERYAHHPFVHVCDAGTAPETRAVRGSNACHLSVRHAVDASRVIVFSVIDNLVKGAAGQAVQCANLMFDLTETSGLSTVPFYP